MQGPAHILAGMVIRRAFSWRYFRAIGIVLTIIMALLMHGIFDKLARSCYSPDTVDFAHPFWLSYHIIMWLVSLVLLYMYWGEYKVGIIFSLLPDIDWLVLYPANALGKEVVFYKTPLIHDALNYFIDNVIPFSYLNQLPDLHQSHWACIFELLLIGILIMIFRMQINRRRNIHF